jgi:hypothetical protein
MSANLANSATLHGNAAFRALVRAALTEHAVDAVVDNQGEFSTVMTRHRLGRAVISDPTRYLDIFSALCADDDAISATADPTAVDPADVRRVISTRWGPVGSSIPNVGS